MDLAVGMPASAMISLANAFDPSIIAALASGPKARMPVRAQRVGDACHQRGFGADHDEIGTERFGQPGDVGRIGGLHLVQPRQLADARVARGGVQLRHRGVAAQGADDRVLASARADHQYSHVGEPTYSNGRICRVWSRRGPTPTALTGAPDSCSIVLT